MQKCVLNEKNNIKCVFKRVNQTPKTGIASCMQTAEAIENRWVYSQL